jgi:hypothetical protein
MLFLAANPLDTGRLRLETELRDVEEGLQRANPRKKNCVQVQTRVACPRPEQKLVG